jgi:hypothetical protein
MSKLWVVASFSKRLMSEFFYYLKEFLIKQPTEDPDVHVGELGDLLRLVYLFETMNFFILFNSLYAKLIV